MKTDQASLSQAEGQLRSQLAALHQERATLANEIAMHENATLAARESQQRTLKQLHESRETLSDLEKKLAAALKPSAIPKPHSAAADSAVASSTSEQARKSQTQLLRARSKNNNPPNKSQVCCKKYLLWEEPGKN